MLQVCVKIKGLKCVFWVDLSFWISGKTFGVDGYGGLKFAGLLSLGWVVVIWEINIGKEVLPIS